MRPLDPYDHSAMLSLEEGFVFLWRIISPAFTGQTQNRYLSANACGDNLQAKVQVRLGNLFTVIDCVIIIKPVTTLSQLHVFYYALLQNDLISSNSRAN